MKLYYDLHIHSKYAYATSKYMNIKTLTKWGLVKGLDVIGTGDFTHPKWFNQLKNELKETSEEGIYESKFGKLNFIISGEVSNIYSKNERLRKIHNILLMPEFETSKQVNELLEKKGKIKGDGRPTFGSYDCEDMVSDLMNINKNILIIPAHIWTPWFSLFGSRSGFDSVSECFGNQTKNIFALETGLSSDALMNNQVSKLDDFFLISNSDCHSAFPHRLGREANILDFEKPSYKELFNTLKNKDKSKFLGTIEVDPNYGKYHLDGHRKCDVRLEPVESNKLGTICPKCNKPLTIGVLNRVNELKDRAEGLTHKNSLNYVSVLPLQEILSFVHGKGVMTKTVWNDYNLFIKKYGTEFNVLLNVPLNELEKFNKGKLLAKIIGLMRRNELIFEPGFDGVYGKINLPKNVFLSDDESISSQEGLNKFF